MAAVTTMDALIQALQGQQRFGWSKGSFTPQATGAFHSMWLVAGEPGPGVAPGSLTPGVIPTDATAGAFPFTNATGDNYLGYVSATGLAVGTLVIFDRIWHNSTTNAATGAQAVTFPGLTRYTTGLGVECWLEWYTVSGAATASNCTVTYTDESGNAGATGTVVMPAVTKSAGQMFPMQFASGDSGIRALSAMNLTVTQTTGTWGLTLMKRLAEIPIRPSDQAASVLNAVDLGLPEIADDACLSMMFQGAVTANTLCGSFGIAKSL